MPVPTLPHIWLSLEVFTLGNKGWARVCIHFQQSFLLPLATNVLWCNIYTPKFTLLFHILVLLRVFLFGRWPQNRTETSPHYGRVLPLHQSTKLCYISIQPLYRWLINIPHQFPVCRATTIYCFLEFVHCSILEYGFILTTQSLNYYARNSCT